MVRNVLYVLVAVLFICGCKEQNKSEKVVQQRHVGNLVCDNTHFNFGDVSKNTTVHEIPLTFQKVTN